MNDSGQLLELARSCGTDPSGDAWEATACLEELERIDLATSRILRRSISAAPWLGWRCWTAGSCDQGEYLGPLVPEAVRRLLHDRPRPTRASCAAAGAGAGKSSEALATLPRPGDAPLPPAPSLIPASALRGWCETARQQIMQRLSGDDLEAYGILTARTLTVATCNSAGLEVVHQGTAAEIRLLALTRGATGTAWAIQRDPAAFEPLTVAEDAAARSLHGGQVRAIAPGRYPILFEPAAVARIALCLISWLLAEPRRLGWLVDQLSGAIRTSPQLLLSTAAVPAPAGAPGLRGDGRGRGRSPLALLPVLNSAPALGLARATLGLRQLRHDPVLEPAWASAPWLLRPVWEVAAGRRTIEELTQGLPDGCWISDLDAVALHGLDSTGDPLLHATTRGGSFRIRRGQLSSRLPEMQLTCGLRHLLSHIEGLTQTRLSVPVTASQPHQDTVVAPSMLVHDLRVGT